MLEWLPRTCPKKHSLFRYPLRILHVHGHRWIFSKYFYFDRQLTNQQLPRTCPVPFVPFLTYLTTYLSRLERGQKPLGYVVFGRVQKFPFPFSNHLSKIARTCLATGQPKPPSCPRIYLSTHLSPLSFCLLYAYLSTHLSSFSYLSSIVRLSTWCFNLGIQYLVRWKTTVHTVTSDSSLDPWGCYAR